MLNTGIVKRLAQLDDHEHSIARHIVVMCTVNRPGENTSTESLIVDNQAHHCH